jgi:hypothetical protein
MKKVLIILVAFISALTVFLYLVDSSSKANKVAKGNIFSDVDVSTNFGKIESLILIGYSAKTGPSGMGCTNLEYLVFGERSYGRVRVRMQRESYSSLWVQRELIIGGNKTFEDECIYG